MRLINRSSKASPLARQACDAALAKHFERFGEFGRQKTRSTYTVAVGGVKVTVEVVNRASSYVATAMIGRRRLRSLPYQEKNNNTPNCTGGRNGRSDFYPG